MAAAFSFKKGDETSFMDTGSRLPWAAALLLLFCAAYFAVTETALASVSRTKIKIASDRGDSRADKALYALDNFDMAISTLLICTNIVHITAATVVTVAVTDRFGLSAVTLSTVITTIVVFFFGEMLPKSIAKKHSERFTLSNAGVLVFFMHFFAPLSSLLTRIGQNFANMTKGDPELSVTEDELYDIIEDMTEEGTLDEDEGELISSAIEFDEKTVGSIMTPRNRILAVNADDSPSVILEQVKNQTHSRLPVYSGDIDHIIGILQIRTFIKTYLKYGEQTNIRELISKPHFIKRSLNIDELRPMMSQEKLTIAVVQDMQGKTVGVISIEDILEELVGDIWDEEDVQGGQKK